MSASLADTRLPAVLLLIPWACCWNLYIFILMYRFAAAARNISAAVWEWCTQGLPFLPNHNTWDTPSCCRSWRKQKGFRVGLYCMCIHLILYVYVYIYYTYIYMYILWKCESRSASISLRMGSSCSRYGIHEVERDLAQDRFRNWWFESCQL